ncbi:MAG: TonB-dependent receptor, partial [Calditrichales bacterium]
MSRFYARIPAICFFSFLIFSVLSAGVTGKIAGLVTDVETKEPLAGANVIVESIWQGDIEIKLDVPLGASVDIDGSYFILNLRPGVYNLRVNYVGYVDEIKTKIQVFVDKTTRVDYELKQQLLETEEIVVTAFTERTVEKDLTATKQVYNVSDVQSIAGVQDISDILELQADVVDDHFRGGRLGESTYLIGGASIVNPLNNSRAFSPIVTGLEQVEVYTSGFSAEYGNAQSGVVNMVTKEGTNKWLSRVEYSSTLPYYKSWGGSEYSPDKLLFYSMLMDPEAWLKENPVNPGKPMWDIGYGVTKYLPEPPLTWPPVFLTHEDSLKMADIGRMLWMLSVRDANLVYDKKMDYRVDFTTGGPISDNAQIFIAARQNLVNPVVPTPIPDLARQFMSNITYAPSQEDKFKFTFIFDNTFENYLNSNWERWLFDRTFAVTKRSNFSSQYGVEWKHIFSPASFADLNLKVLHVTEEDRIDLLEADQVINDYSSGRNWVDYTGPSNHRVGRLNDDRGDTKTVTYYMGASWTNQMDRFNLIKGGLQFSYYDLNVDYEYNVTDFQTMQHLIFRTHPYEGALYFQDKMEFDGMIANLGLRFDFYNLNSNYFLDQFHPLEIPDNVAKTELYTRLQPRLGISFPVSEQTVFHLNYGTFTQRPSFNQLFYNLINDNSPTTKVYTLGNPLLKPENTKSYDVGIVHRIAPGLQLDVSAYYKDVKDLVQQAFIVDTTLTSYLSYINRDYADIKGFHISLEKSTGAIRGYLRYNIESATGKTSNPDNLDVPPVITEDPAIDKGQYSERYTSQGDVYLDYDRRHKAVFNIRYLTPPDAYPQFWGMRPLSDISISFTFRYATGRPYTWDASGQGLKYNKRTPTEEEGRMRIEKKIKWAASTMTAYAEVYNLFNKHTWNYSRTFNNDRNLVRWETDRENILTDNEYAPYVTRQ